MFLELPKRKTYRLEITTKYGMCIIRYKQACHNDTEEYYDGIEAIKEKVTAGGAGKELMNLYIFNYFEEYRCDFIDKHIYKIEKDKRYTRKKQIIQEAKKNFVYVLDKLVSTYHCHHNSIYQGLPKPNYKNSKPTFFDGSMFHIHSATGTRLSEIGHEYTSEQVGWMIDKLTHDYYWTFKEGEKVNYIAREKAIGSKGENHKKLLEEKIKDIKDRLPKNLYSQQQ